MPKKRQPKYLKEFKKAVKNAKAKIRRTQKKYGIDLDTEINIPSLKEMDTIKDFKQVTKNLKNFTRRSNAKYQFVKNKYDVVASKQQIREIEKKNKLSQRKADKEIKKLQNKPYIQGGKIVSTQEQRMLQMKNPAYMGIYRPKDFNFNEVRSQARLKEIEQNVEKRLQPNYYDKRKVTMKNNFMDILSQSLHSDADELLNKLKDMPADDFYEMYMMFDEFDFALWDSDGIIFGSEDEAIQHVSKMLTLVERYETGEVNMDLKPF